MVISIQYLMIVVGVQLPEVLSYRPVVDVGLRKRYPAYGHSLYELISK